MNKQIWIAWEQHRRNKSICEILNVELFELTVDSNKLLKYFFLISKTLSIIYKKNPYIIFVMNPSIVLAMIVVLYGILFRKKIVVDAHNIGIYFEHSNRMVKYLGQFVNTLIMRLSDITIVTNNELAKYVSKKKGNPYIFPDPFPRFGNFNKIKLQGNKNIFYICSYAEDEPYLNLIESAKFLNNDIYIYISGRIKKNTPIINLPNIIMTGYLSEQDFVNFLFSVDVVVDLTLRDNCLLCGAYETIAAEKPLILSKTNALQIFFKNAAIYTDNSPNDIASKIKMALEQTPDLIKATQTFKKAQIVKIQKQALELESMIKNV